MPTLVRTDPKQALRDNMLFLREYAKRVIVEKDESLTPLGDVKTALVQDVWNAGRSYGLTERDLVVLIFQDVFSGTD
jgi:hypothetical protein